MKPRLSLVCTRLFLLAWAVACVLPAEAASRFSVFKGNPRGFLGMGDGNGELYSVNPQGAKNLRNALRHLGSIDYTSVNGGMTFGFGAGGSPRSVRSLSGGSVALSRVRGGGLRALFKNLAGARVGSRVFHAPSSSATLRDAIVEPNFNLTGFSRFGYSRQQVENDVDVFGEQLATLFSDDFGQLLLLLQRLANEIATQNISTIDVPVAQIILNAGLGTISTLPNSKDILTRAVDLLLNTKKPFASELANFRANIIGELFNVDRSVLSYLSIDPDSSGHISLTDTGTSVLESNGSTFIYCTRGGGSKGAASARVILQPDSGVDIAEPGHDFIFGERTVKWVDGETGPKAVFFKIINDRTPENLETFTLQCVDVAGAQAFSPINIVVGIVDDDGPRGENSGFGSGRNTELICDYSWPRSQKDLDTGTTFSGFVGSTPTSYTLGYNYFELFNGVYQSQFAPFMAFTGDDQGVGGHEVVRIDIDGAVAENFITTSLNVQCRADWYAPAGGHGPATLTFYFRDKRTGRTSQPAVLDNIMPTTTAHTNNSTRAITPVGSVTGSYDSFYDFFVYAINP